MMRLAALIFGGLLLWGCAPDPQPASPAFWHVEAPGGGKAWLLGTIHSLERPADWRSPEIDAGLAQSDLVLVEVAGLGDSSAMGKVFEALATSANLPPLSMRVEPSLRDNLGEVLDAHALSDDGFDTTETWAAALIIAQAEAHKLDSKYGIDRAVIEAAGAKPIEELEGAAAQLSLFDTLPEAEQRDLLEAIVRDAQSLDGESPALAEAWRKGDMKTITRETGKGLLADPELRQALFTGRNARWAERISTLLADGAKPFVAVGAAHMAGPDGLPAMLEERGFAVSRVQ